jgi:hypothetical protein
MTISGTIAAGFSGSTNATTDTVTTTSVAGTADGVATPVVTTSTRDISDKGGFGIDTAEVVIAGSETLENGLTVSGSMSMGGLTRGNADVNGQNAHLAIAGDFGKFTIASGRSGSGISGVSSAANNLSEEVLNFGAGDADNEGVSYALPAMGGLSLSVGASEAGETGVGQGDDDTRLFAKAGYSAGAFSLTADYWDLSPSVDRIRINAGVSVDAITVKAGVEDRDGAGREYAVGADFAASDALTLGVAYGSSQRDGADNDAKGYSVGATYAMSSNVSVNAAYTSATTDSAAGSTDREFAKVLMTLAF